MLPRVRGSCRGATEGANAVKAELAPSGPLGHLPRIAGEDLSTISRWRRSAGCARRRLPGLRCWSRS
ncbi:hypothetical protein CSW62_16405 [Caulobacter sp. FWC2]|nr:hypothetical protein CSW62_16405 [Caulobacter sp. FWC2]